MHTIKAGVITVGLVLASASLALAAGNGVPDNPISGTPGNKAAAQELVAPGSQANCTGQFFSHFAQQGEGNGVIGRIGKGSNPVNGDSIPETIGNLHFLGSVIGAIPPEDCVDFFPAP